MMLWRRCVALVCAWMVVPLILYQIAAEISVAMAADGRMFTLNQAESIPHVDSLLVLGAAERVADGRLNIFYQQRIQATVRIFQTGVAPLIIVSGDNGRADYDEPTAMRQSLIQAGVPPSVIFRDFAGFRTLDSVLRAQAIFNMSHIAIISQAGHVRRAVYLARSHGIEAVGIVAGTVPGAAGWRQWTRERAAVALAFADIALLQTEPHFYGEPIIPDPIMGELPPFYATP